MKRRLTLTKGAHRFVFEFRDGCESELLSALLRQARDPQSPLDFNDVAVLCFQLGKGARPALVAARD